MAVEGQDSIAMVELVASGRVVERYFPEDHAESLRLPGRAKCRLQFGWGPWSALNLGASVLGMSRSSSPTGALYAALGCFQSAPFAEHLRDKLEVISEREIRLQMSTTREHAFAEDPTKSIVCELEGGPETRLTVELRAPTAKTVTRRLADLRDDNVVEFTGGFTTESFIVHPLVGPSEYAAHIRWHHKPSGDAAPDWYYVRVTQHNGQMAWSSPIWVG